MSEPSIDSLLNDRFLTIPGCLFGLGSAAYWLYRHGEAYEFYADIHHGKLDANLWLLGKDHVLGLVYFLVFVLVKLIICPKSGRLFMGYMCLWVLFINLVYIQDLRKPQVHEFASPYNASQYNFTDGIEQLQSDSPKSVSVAKQEPQGPSNTNTTSMSARDMVVNMNQAKSREQLVGEATKRWDSLQSLGCCGLFFDDWQSLKYPKSCCSDPKIYRLVGINGTVEQKLHCLYPDINHQDLCVDKIHEMLDYTPHYIVLIAVSYGYLSLVHLVLYCLDLKKRGANWDSPMDSDECL